VGERECMGNMKNVYTILIEKPERNRPPRRSRHRWRIILKWQMYPVLN
jgi:hypothetical protein